MSSLISHSEPVEFSFEALQKRHEKEIQEMEAKHLVELSKLKKKKARKELEAFQLRELDDLKTLHRDQYDDLEEWVDAGGGVPLSQDNNLSLSEEQAKAKMDAEVAEVAARQRAEAEAEAEAGASELAKIAKAQKKRDKRAAKAHAEEDIKRSIAANEGPSLREVEIKDILSSLKSKNPKLSILEIQSDGNCLYRAIAHQLSLHASAAGQMGSQSKTGHMPSGSTDQSYAGLRMLAAQYMRMNEGEFRPFLDLSAGTGTGTDDAGADAAYEEYCLGVERTHGGDAGPVWGGHLEIQALARALHKPIEVYSAGSGVLVMSPHFGSGTEAGYEDSGGADEYEREKRRTETDDNDNDDVIRLSYHKHYFALGEHYNSITVRPTADKEDGDVI